MNPRLSFVSPVSQCRHHAFSRTLRDLADVFSDAEAVRSRLAQDNPVIYEFHEYVAAHTRGELATATCTLFPGKVGKEFHMTRGHFHDPADYAEVYCVESGKGLLLLQSRTGHFASVEMRPARSSTCRQTISIGRRTSATSPSCFSAFTPQRPATITARRPRQSGSRRSSWKSMERRGVVDNPRRVISAAGDVAGKQHEAPA